LVILAAGMSTRYGAVKQVEPLGPGGEALLDYAVYDALRAGFGRIVLVVRRELQPVIEAHVSARWARVPVDYAFQENEPGRVKPWGTAQAVLAAAGQVDGPFGVCNADDFYGAPAYAAVAAHLAAGTTEQALVGYRLRDTLSSHGGVSRAVCEADPSGLLRRVVELRDVRETEGAVRGVDRQGRPHVVPDDAPVSMNLWGFLPDVVRHFRDGFAVFRATQGGDPLAEYQISEAANDQVAAGRIRLRVLPGGAGWMGITHPRDRDAVAARLQRLVVEGHYPATLGPPRGVGERT
jgi:hypothetical protein